MKMIMLFALVIALLIATNVITKRGKNRTAVYEDAYAKANHNDTPDPEMQMSNVLNFVDSTSRPVLMNDEDICITGCGPDADYKGGMLAWQKFLKYNLVYPQEAVNENVEGKVIVEFCIDSNAVVKNIRAIYGPVELRKAAIEAIRLSSGNWTPALQNGRYVKSYKKQPITFKLIE